MKLEVGRVEGQETEKEPRGKRDGRVGGGNPKKEKNGGCQKGSVTGLEEREEMECVPEQSYGEDQTLDLTLWPPASRTC